MMPVKLQTLTRDACLGPCSYITAHTMPNKTLPYSWVSLMPWCNKPWWPSNAMHWKFRGRRRNRVHQKKLCTSIHKKHLVWMAIHLQHHRQSPLTLTKSCSDGRLQKCVVLELECQTSQYYYHKWSRQTYSDQSLNNQSSYWMNLEAAA